MLIHSATGGVGLAALQVARHVGARIFATAGTEEKRQWLREQGIEHVMNSRSLQFAEQIMAATCGEGVDVVLNSLSGAAVEASLSVLGPDGRFVELGKRDIHADRAVGLGHFKKGISYSHVDLAGWMGRRRASVRAAAGSDVDAASGVLLEPLPIRTYPIERASEAFHDMAQAATWVSWS